MVRAYRESDSASAASLLYQSSGGLFDRYAGNRRHAERALARGLASEGTATSADVVTVAELEGRVAGVMAAMPFGEWTPRANAFLRVTLRVIPPWRWPQALWLYRASGRTAPEPPRTSFYVDSLATAPDLRRRGVATALLAEAERLALAGGLDSVSLDTWADNQGARALYARAGFDEVAHTPPVAGLPGGLSLLKRL